MAVAAYNIIAKLQIQGPDNLSVVTRNIQNQLNSIKANVQINAPGISGQLAKQIEDVKKGISGLSSAATASNRTLSDLNKTVGDSVNGFQRFAEQAGLATRRFLAFSAATTAIFGIVNTLKSGISSAISFQREMVRLAQVSTDASSSIQEVEKQITDLSTSLGVSSADLAKSAVTLRQAGFSAEQLSAALKTVALTDLSPTFDSIEKTTEAVVAASSQFKLAAKDYVGAFGSINAVAAQFAVESGDVAEAIKKAGGAFAVSAGQLTSSREALNEFISLFTSVRATTRESAAEIATGLRTIFARVQRTTTGDALRQLGIDLRFTQEEAQKLGNVNLTGQFVGAFEAVNRLSQALANIPSTDSRFAAIVEELGGVRQISRVIPLIQQFSTAQQALVVAQSGQISLTLAAEKAQDAFAIKLNRVKEEFLALGRAAFQSDFFQGIATGALQAASAFGEVLKFISPLIQPLTILAGLKFAQNALPALSSFAGSLVGGRKRGFNRGGIVPGVGDTDSVDATLTPGEFVVRKSSAQSIGYGTLNRLNNGGRRAFAQGGRLSLSNVYDGVGNLSRIYGKNFSNLFNDINLDELDEGGASFTQEGRILSVNDLIKRGGLESVLFHESIHGIETLSNNPLSDFQSQASGLFGKLDKAGLLGTGRDYALNTSESLALSGEFFSGLRPNDDSLENLFINAVKSGAVTNKELLAKQKIFQTVLGKAKFATGGSVEDRTFQALENLQKKFPRIPFNKARTGFSFLPTGIDGNSASFNQFSGLINIVPNDNISDNKLQSLIFHESVHGFDRYDALLGNKNSTFSSEILRDNPLAGFISSGRRVLNSLDFSDNPNYLKYLLQPQETLANFAELFSGISSSGLGNRISSSSKIDLDALKLAEKGFDKNLIPFLESFGANKGIREFLNPKKFAKGGINPKDTIPAYLTPGEFVFNQDAASSIGLPALDYMNRTGKLPRGFNNGGYVNKANGGQIINAGKIPFNPDGSISGQISTRVEQNLNKLTEALAKFGITAEQVIKDLANAKLLAEKGPGGLKDLKVLGFGNDISDRPSSAQGVSIQSVLDEIVKQQGLKSPQDFFDKVGGGAVRTLGLSGVNADEVSSQVPTIVSTIITDLIKQGRGQSDITNVLTGKSGNPVFKQLEEFANSFGKGVGNTSFDEAKGAGEDGDNFVKNPFINRTSGFIDTIKRISGEEFLNKQAKALANLEADVAANLNKSGDVKISKITEGNRKLVEGQGAGDYNSVLAELRRLGINPKDLSREGVAKEYFDFIDEQTNANGGLGVPINPKRAEPFNLNSFLSEQNNGLGQYIGPSAPFDLSSTPPIKPPTTPVLPSPGGADEPRRSREILLTFNDIAETVTKNAKTAKDNIQQYASVEEKANFAAGRTLARIDEQGNLKGFIPKSPDFSAGAFPPVSNERVLTTPLGFEQKQLLNGQFSIGQLNQIASTTESKDIRDLIRGIVLENPSVDNLARLDSFQGGDIQAIIRNNQLRGFTPQQGISLASNLQGDSPTQFSSFKEIDIQGKILSEAIKDSSQSLTSKFGTTNVSQQTQVEFFNNSLAKKENEIFEQIVQKEIQLLQAISEKTNGFKLDNKEVEKLALERARSGSVSQTIRGDIASTQTIQEAISAGLSTETQEGFFGRQKRRFGQGLSSVGTGISKGLDFFRNNKTSRFFDRPALGQSLLFGAPLLAEQFFGQTKTAEEAIGSQSSSSEFTRNRGLNNAVQGGISFGLIGGAVGGPLGAVIGGAVGALRSFISGVKDSEQELRQAKIGKAVGEFSDRISVILASNGNASSVNNTVALNKIEEAIAQATERNKVTADGDSNQFIELQRKSLRDNFGQQIAQITQFLNKTAEDLAKNNLGVSVASLNTKLTDGSNKLSQRLLKLLDSLGVGEGIREQLKKTIGITQGQESARKGAERNQIFQETRVASFGRLVNAVESASDSLFGLQQRSASLSDIFSGNFGAQNIRLGPEVRQFGSQNQGLLNTIANTTGVQGVQLRDYANVLNEIEQRLPSIIINSLGGVGRENFDIGTEIGLRLREALGGKNASPIALEAITSIQGQIAQLSTGEEGPGKVLTQAKDNLLNFTKDLTANFSAQIRETQNSFKTRLEEGLNAYASALASARQREIQIIDERVKLGELFVKFEENRVREENQLAGRSGPALISREALETPLNNRQRGLTGLGDNAFNVEAVSQRYLQSLQQYSQAQENLSNGINRGADAKKLFELQRQFDSAQNNVDRFGRALRNLTDVTNRTVFAQQRLADLDREEGARRSFAERIATADFGELANLNRSAALLGSAIEQGSIKRFSTEDRRSVIELLRSLGTATLTGVGDGTQKADEVLNRFIQDLTGIGLNRDQQNERDRLNKEIQQRFIEAGEAQRTLITGLTAANNDLKTILSNQNDTFLAKLAQVLTQAQRLDLTNRIGSVQSNLTEIQNNRNQADALQKFGIRSQADLDRVKGIVPNISEFVGKNQEIAAFTKNLVRAEGLKFNVAQIDKNQNKSDIAKNLLGQVEPQILDFLSKAGLEGSANEILGNFRSIQADSLRTGVQNGLLKLNQANFNKEIKNIAEDAFKQAVEISPSLAKRRDELQKQADVLGKDISSKLPGIDLKQFNPQSLQQIEEGIKKFDGTKLSIDKLGQAATDAELGLRQLKTQLDQLNQLAPQGTGKYNGGNIGGTDRLPAMLTRGEFVVNASATSRNLPLLNQINKGVAGFANGGIADGNPLRNLFSGRNAYDGINLERFLKQSQQTIAGLRSATLNKADAEEKKLLRALREADAASRSQSNAIGDQMRRGSPIPISDDYTKQSVRNLAKIRGGDFIRRLPGNNIQEKISGEASRRAERFYQDQSLANNVGSFQETGRYANSRNLDEGQRRIFSSVNERRRNNISEKTDANSQFIRQDVLDKLKQFPIQIGAAFDKFDKGVAKLAETLTNIPTDINLNGNQKIEVVFNGAEVFANIEGDLKNLVETKVKETIAKVFKEQLPDANVNIT